jgi:hypothetical protein
VGGLALGAGVLLLAAPRVWAQSTGAPACSQFATFTALGAADGMQTIQSAPGATLVDTVDAELPGAQAEIDSLAGSTGWAGAPYSSTVAGNVGNANASPNQVPVFATSSYPSEPNAKQTTPGGTIEATSGADSSSARAAGGGPSSSPVSTGQVSSSASASCAADGTLQAVADNQVQVFGAGGVLQIGSVTSHAAATLAPNGRPVFNGSLAVAGATVLGQQVAVTNRGLVLGATATPLPANPLTQVLSGAGITVTYLAESENPRTGEVLAPGLEIQVARQAPGVGTGPVTSTYVLGRAEAVASTTGGSGQSMGVGPSPSIGALPGSAGPAGQATTSPATPAGPSGANPAPAATTPAAGNGSAPTAPAPAVAPPAGTRRAPGGSGVIEPVSYLANTSWLSVYGTLGAGALVLVGAAILFGATGVRLRWR